MKFFASVDTVGIIKEGAGRLEAFQVEVQHGVVIVERPNTVVGQFLSNVFKRDGSVLIEHGLQSQVVGRQELCHVGVGICADFRHGSGRPRSKDAFFRFAKLHKRPVLFVLLAASAEDQGKSA